MMAARLKEPASLSGCAVQARDSVASVEVVVLVHWQGFGVNLFE